MSFSTDVGYRDFVVVVVFVFVSVMAHLVFCVWVRSSISALAFKWLILAGAGVLQIIVNDTTGRTALDVRFEDLQHSVSHSLPCLVSVEPAILGSPPA